MFDKEIDLPEKTPKYNFHLMEVGDSLFVEKEKASTTYAAARVFAHRRKKEGKSFSVAGRKQPCGGVRIWRTA